MNRPIGSHDPSLDEEPFTTVREALDYIHMFFRKDYGGADENTVVSKRLTAFGISVNPDTIQAYILGADQAKDGIQTRVMRRINAVKKLIGI